MACKQMKNTVLSVVKAHGKLDAFMKGGDFHLRVENAPYMPLVIERHGNRVSVSHYFEQNGDLVPDPDMEMRIGADGEWYPTSFTNVFGYREIMVFDADGSLLRKDLRQEREVTSFSNLWARNINFQDFAHGKAVSV